MRLKKISVLLACIITSVFTTHAQNINNPNKPGPMGTQVNTLTGNFVVPRTDIFIPARKFDISISFYYNSHNFYIDNGFGLGWSFYYDIKHRRDSVGNRIIEWGDGREDTYDSLPGGLYQTPVGFYCKLTEYQSGKYLLTELDSTKYFFAGNLILNIAH